MVRAAVVAVLALSGAGCARAEITHFPDPLPGSHVIEYWRLTHDPAIRDHANYHNTDCFSPDGRYVCVTRYVAPDRYHVEPQQVRVIDLHTGEDRLIGIGSSPRWARQHNWLFYVRTNREPGDSWEARSEVIRHDLVTGQETVITRDMQVVSSVDRLDQWVVGNRWRYDIPGATPRTTVRARIAPDAELEQICELNEANIAQCNPGHDMISMRCQMERPFEASRLWMDLDGGNRRIGMIMLENAHDAWSGDGTWQLIGNGRARGRRWDQPFPSDAHVLSWMSFGDICPCGRSGRWICGDYGIADLRTGDGAHLLRAPSELCYPASVIDQSGPYDADPKGSPDGTKICFVSNYPFGTAPWTRLAEALGPDQTSVRVASTAGFAQSGEIEVLTEVIGYASKTDTSFEGLERHRYSTGGRATLKAGLDVTDFAARLMTDEEAARKVEPWPWLARAVSEAGMGDDSPLLRQRQTDVYMSVVRRPDAPWLRLTEGVLEVIPGENHRETAGYRLERDGAPLGDEPLTPGTEQALEAGTYRALAVEWSGLVGLPSPEVTVPAGTRLRILAEIPEDFAWVVDEWRMGDREVTREEALAAPQAEHRLRHRLEGVFRIERYEGGRLVSAEDVNADGFACRRESYAEGLLAERQTWEPTEPPRLRARELFAPDGYKTEEMHFGYPDPRTPTEVDHWWYDHGWPLRRVQGGVTWEKRGDDWVRAE